MRPLLITVAAGLALLAGAWPAAADEQPKNIRVSLQFIELPHPALTDLLAAKDSTGPALHEQALGLVKNGTAKLLESCVVTTPSGHRASIESVREVIYPAIHEQEQFPGSVCGLACGSQGLAPGCGGDGFPIIPARKHDFESRNSGVSLEIEPTLEPGDRLIELRFRSEAGDMLRLETWRQRVDQRGDVSIRYPVLETWRLATGLILTAGQFEMVAVIPPKPKAPVPATPREKKGGN